MSAIESLPEIMIRERVMFGASWKQLSAKHGIDTKEIKRIFKENVAVLKAALDAKRVMLRQDYLSMTPIAMRAIKRILRINPTEPVIVDGKDTGRYYTNAQLCKVQKEITDGVLETAGAKRSKRVSKGTTLNLQNNVGAPRSRKRGDVDEVPASEILDSIGYDKNEIKEIT